MPSGSNEEDIEHKRAADAGGGRGWGRCSRKGEWGKGTEVQEQVRERESSVGKKESSYVKCLLSPLY